MQRLRRRQRVSGPTSPKPLSPILECPCGISELGIVADCVEQNAGATVSSVLGVGLIESLK